MQEVPVKSSNISHLGHDGQKLSVRFVKGSVYEYAGVPFEVFERLLEAESVGRAFKTEVIGKYQGVPVNT